MATNYPIGDFLIQLKNISMAYGREVSLPGTKLIRAVANVLKDEGYINTISEDKSGILTMSLAYKSKAPVLMDLKLVSKPGLRIYMNTDEIFKKRGASIFILSTPKGIFSSKKALKEKVGGEVIAEIW